MEIIGFKQVDNLAHRAERADMSDKQINKINSIDVLSCILEEVGYEKVEIIPHVMEANESTTCRIYVSYEKFSKIHSKIKDQVLPTNREDV